MHLLLAPALAGVVLVEADEIAVVAFVQGLVAKDRDLVRAHLGKHEVERTLRAFERGGEGDVELDPARLQFCAGLFRLGDALCGEIDVLPAGEQILQIPFALAVPDEDEETFGHRLRRQMSERPSTSSME